MEQNKVAESIMVQFQKLDSQEQNKVFCNLYQVTQKTRVYELEALQQRMASIKDDIEGMDSVIKNNSLDFNKREPYARIASSGNLDNAPLNGKWALGFKVDEDYLFPGDDKCEDPELEVTGVKLRTLDDCRP